jgi:hypothetical protein
VPPVPALPASVSFTSPVPASVIMSGGAQLWQSEYVPMVAVELGSNLQMRTPMVCVESQMQVGSVPGTQGSPVFAVLSAVEPMPAAPLPAVPALAPAPALPLPAAPPFPPVPIVPVATDAAVGTGLST